MGYQFYIIWNFLYWKLCENLYHLTKKCGGQWSHPDLQSLPSKWFWLTSWEQLDPQGRSVLGWLCIVEIQFFLTQFSDISSAKYVITGKGYKFPISFTPVWLFRRLGTHQGNPEYSLSYRFFSNRYSNILYGICHTQALQLKIGSLFVNGAGESRALQNVEDSNASALVKMS